MNLSATETPDQPAVEASPDRPPWMADFDCCVAAFYDGDLVGGQAACDRALCSPDLPDRYREATRRNLIFYAPDLATFGPDWHVRRLRLDLPEGWQARDASIATVQDGEGSLLALLLRCAPRAGEEQGSSAERLLLARLDGSATAIVSADWLAGAAVGRLLLAGCGRDLLAAGLARGSADDRGHMTVWRVDPAASALVERWRLDAPEISPGEAWAPVAGAPPEMLCRISPTLALRLDAGQQDGEPTLAAAHSVTGLAAELLPVTPLVPDGDSWLGVVAHWAAWPDGRQIALHRLASFDREWRLTGLSAPFRVPGPEDGLAGGFAIHGDSLLLSGGEDAASCWIAEAPLASARALLGRVDPVDARSIQWEDLPAASRRFWLATLPDPADGDAPGWFERGERWQAAQMPERAVDAFRRVLAEADDDVLAARAGYAAANLLGSRLRRWQEAAFVAEEGFQRDPERVEMAWIAGFSWYWAGRADRAARWARVAIGLNAQIDAGLIPPRRELASHLARLEGPWDVLRHALRAIGDHDAADWADFRYRIATQRSAYANPPKGQSIARGPDQGVVMPSGPRAPMDEVNPVPRMVYCCWTGENPLTPRRQAALDTIRDSAGCPVVLVTPENLSEFIVEPLHPAYDLLSLTHRSDYLRAYLMHHHGGGYTDIKFQSFDWTPYFDLLDASPHAYLCGAREPEAAFIPHREPFDAMPESFFELCGQIHFIARPLTIFTAEWMDAIHRILDRHLDALRQHPGTYHPRAVRGGVNEDDTGGAFTDSQYPLHWNAILAEPLLELMYRHRGDLLPEMPLANRYWYR